MIAVASDEKRVLVAHIGAALEYHTLDVPRLQWEETYKSTLVTRHQLSMLPVRRIDCLYVSVSAMLGLSASKFDFREQRDESRSKDC